MDNCYIIFSSLSAQLFLVLDFYEQYDDANAFLLLFFPVLV